MGCLESIEQKVAAIEERIRQMFEADKFFVNNMQVVSMTYIHGQDKILGDFQYMTTNDQTRILLRKFLTQLRNLNFFLIEELFDEIYLKQLGTEGEIKIRQDLLGKRPKEKIELMNSMRTELGSIQQKQIGDGLNKLIPKYVARLELMSDKQEVYNYAEELLIRSKELIEQWWLIYKKYREQHIINNKNHRKLRKLKYLQKKEIHDEWQEIQDYKNTQEKHDQEKAEKEDKENLEQKKKTAKEVQKETEQEVKFKEKMSKWKNKINGVNKDDKKKDKQEEKKTEGKSQEKVVPEEKKKEGESQQIVVPEEEKDKFKKWQGRPEPKDQPPFSTRFKEDFDDFMFWLRSHQIPPLLYQKESDEWLDMHDKYFRTGLKEIAKGNVAVVVLAAGLDNRIKTKEPKGFIQLPLNSKKCVFDLYADRIITTQRLAALYRPDKAFIRWTDSVHVYVMTSEANDEQTKKLFRQRLHFGLWKKNIHFFQQKSIPYLSKSGQILMKSKLNIFNAPEGAGGVYEAIEANGLLDEWKRKGIQYVHFMTNDNALGKPADPILLGMLKGLNDVKSRPLDLVCKTFKPTETDTKVGRLCFQGGLPNVVDWKDMKEQDQQLNDAFMGDFAMRLDTIERIIKHKNQWITYHPSQSKVRHYIPPDNKDPVGKISPKPEENNAVKFEKYIFDPFRLIHPKRFGVYEVKREEEVAFIKEAYEVDVKEGEDNDEKRQVDKPYTPLSAAFQVSKLHYDWLKKAGYKFEETAVMNCRFCKEDRGKDKQKELDNEYLEGVKENDESKMERNRVDIYRRRNFVEIDQKQTLHGENIPKPEDDKQKFMIPYLRTADELPIKVRLPWGLDQIYRYM